MYTVDDVLKIDPMEFLKKNKDMFFQYQDSICYEIISKVLMDAISEGAYPLQVSIRNEFYVIASNKNWLNVFDEMNVKWLFSNLIPNKKLGQNSIRSEVILNAYMNTVVFICNNDIFVIKGDIEVNDLAEIKSLLDYKFSIVFR